MLNMLKKAFATDPISREDAEALIKEFTVVLEARAKKIEREFHLQLTILSKRIDSIEFDVNGGKRRPKIPMAPAIRRGRPKNIRPAAKIKGL